MIQSLLAVFLGMNAVAIMTTGLNPIINVLLAFVVGYAASRHVLVQTSDNDFTLTTLVCGLIFAEISWLSQSWGIIYTFGASGIRIPQVALILTIFAFMYNSARAAMVKYQEDFRLKQVAGPILFGTVLITIILLGFSNPIFNI